jgi:hypothetical protein
LEYLSLELYAQKVHVVAYDPVIKLIFIYITSILQYYYILSKWKKLEM